MKNQSLEYQDNESDLFQLFDAAPVPMVLSRLDGSFEYVNPALLSMLGYELNEIYRPDVFITHPDDYELSYKIRDILTSDPSTPVVAERSYVHKSGKIIPSILTIVAQTDKKGRPKRFIAQIVDISERKKTEEKLQMAALVYKNSREGVMITDPDANIIDVNPAFTDITGYDFEEVVGKNARILNSDIENDDFYKAFWHQLDTVGTWEGEIRSRRKNGEIYTEHLSINTDLNPDGSPNRRIAQFIDISTIKKSEDTIYRLAYYDALTGLPNRNKCAEDIKKEIIRAKENSLSFAFFLIDLDGFKEVNDYIGHEAGDQLLIQVSERLSNCMLDDDVVSRLGGDEFTIRMRDLDKVDLVANHVLEKLAEPFQLGDEKVYLSGSIGITVYPRDADTLSDLLRKTDQAMYEAKKQGRNRYRYFDQYMHLAVEKRMSLVNDIRDAIIEQQFELYYQPIINFKTNQVYKAEALIRWQHPQKGMISPVDFIPVAEETGAIVTIGGWVFRQALSQVVEWQKKYNPEFQISINTSPTQYKSEKCEVAAWVEQLDQHLMTRDSISVEITENLIMDFNDLTKKKLLDFRDAGIPVSLDDFGTGYSSLSYLRRFDIDYLKIDQSFVRDMENDADKHVLCESIILMAHKLGIEVIAEGIENRQQHELLLSAGCDFGQGYLFSKPLPADEFEQFIGQSIIG